MKYNKQPIDLPTQLKILESRGLDIGNKAQALKLFSSVSYFRFANYWKIFESDFSQHIFCKGTTLDLVVSVYAFDRELRNIVFTMIQDVEIALRTRVIHHFSMSYGPFWFMNNSLFLNQNIFQNCLLNLQTEVKRSKEEFIQDHYKKYDEPPMPPVWKTLEVATFGTLSKLFCNMRDSLAKKKVSQDFGLPQYKFLESWIRSLSVLRNYCAHHARLWNRRFPMIPRLPSRLPLDWIATAQVRPMKIYAQLSALLYLESSVYPQSNAKDRLIALLKCQNAKYLIYMGFPENWQEQPLWNCKNRFS